MHSLRQLNLGVGDVTIVLLVNIKRGREFERSWRAMKSLVVVTFTLMIRKYDEFIFSTCINILWINFSHNSPKCLTRAGWTLNTRLQGIHFDPT